MCLLIVDGLAEQILVELSSRINHSNDTNSEKDFKVESILSLMASTDENISNIDQLSPIKNMLEKFTVGTDKRKEMITGLPDPAFIGPIKDVINISVEKKAILAMGQLGIPEEKRRCNIEKTEVDMSLFKPDYMGIYFKLNAIGIKIGQSEILGQKILELRAILGIEKLTERERASMRQEKEMKSLWKKIIHRANTRECKNTHQ